MHGTPLQPIRAILADRRFLEPYNTGGTRLLNSGIGSIVANTPLAETSYSLQNEKHVTDLGAARNDFRHRIWNGRHSGMGPPRPQLLSVWHTSQAQPRFEAASNVQR